MKKLSFFDGVTTIWDTIKLWWNDWSNQLVVSLAAILLSLTVVLYPVALFGVYHQAVDLSHDLRTGLGGFWGGIKTHWKPALIWGLVNSLGAAVFGFSMWFYGNSIFVIAPILVWTSFLTLAFWLSWQFLSAACFFLQEPQTLRLAWKNGLALMLSHPLYLLPISVFLLALTFVSVRYFIPMVAGGEALLALVSLRAVQNTINSNVTEA